MNVMCALALFPFIGWVRFGKHSTSGELFGPFDFETSDMGARELVRPVEFQRSVPTDLGGLFCFDLV